MTNLIDTDVFKRCKQSLLEAGVITEDFILSDKYNELFYAHKGKYVMESLMYPMFMLFKTTQLGDVETEYFHVILNMFVNEHPEYMEILREYKMTDKLLNLYDAEIRYADAKIRRFFKKLNRKNRNWLKNTLTVITADHGEEFYERGAYGHNAQLHDEILRVPLIFISNELKKLKKIKQKDIKNIIDMRDLAPTILKLLGLPPEPSFTGKSFADLIYYDQEIQDDPIHKGVFSETFHKEGITRFSNLHDPSIKRIISYRTSKWKYIINEETMNEELYDLENDPEEKINVIKEYPKLNRIFRNKIVMHLKEKEISERNLKDLTEKKKITQAIRRIKI